MSFDSELASGLVVRAVYNGQPAVSLVLSQEILRFDLNRTD